MIYGIGNDICDLRRIEESQARHGDRFAQRILGPQELVVWRARGARWPARAVSYLATRFSAKEAFSKAIGLGMVSPMSWRRCEILNGEGGKPFIALSGELEAWFTERRLRAHVSISDESDYAATLVIVETID